MLNFAEQLLLLALDDEDGVIRALPRLSIETAIAAAMLEELTFLRKIDVTPQIVYIEDATPLHIENLLDEVFALIAADKGERPIAYWLHKICEHFPDLTERVLDAIVAKKILARETRRVLWIFERTRYRVVDDREINTMKNRLREIIETGEIPDPREMVLISLTRACRLFLAIFTPEEREIYAPQIDKIAKFAFVGQTLSKSLREIEHAIGMMNDVLYRYSS